MKYMLTILLGFSVLTAFSQTNTFPDNVGIGTADPLSYSHGGNNRVLEILNPNGIINSQSHLILSTGSVVNGTSIGSVTWVAKNSPGSQMMAYIASQLQNNAGVVASGNLVFATSNGTSVVPRMFIDKDGLVGVGIQDTRGYKLAVAGNAIAESVTVKLQGAWPDYVFNKDYQLPSLSETEKSIKENGHLPGIPSAADVKTNGIDLGEMNAMLLKKVEELTLHLIEKDKQIADQQKSGNALSSKFDLQQQQINQLIEKVRSLSKSANQ